VTNTYFLKTKPNKYWWSRTW